MSDSEQNRSGNNEEGGTRFVWMGLSLVTHGALLAWLIFFWPATEIKVPAEGESFQSETTASPEEMQRVAEQIVETQAEEVRAKIEEMLETQKRLNEAEDRKQAELMALANEQTAEAPQKTKEALEAVQKAQAEALQAETDTAAAANEFAQAKASENAAATPEEKERASGQSAAAKDKMTGLQQKAKDAQYAAATAQSEAMQQLNLQQDEAIQTAKTTQEEARKAQDEANKLQDEAVVKTTQIEQLRKTADRQQGLADTARQKKEASDAEAVKKQEAITKSETDLATQKQTLAELQTKATEAKALEEQTTGEKEKKRAVEETKKAAGAAGKLEAGLANMEKKLEASRKSLEQTLAEGKNAQEKAEQEAAKAEQAQAALKQAPEKVAELQKQALEAQQKALEIQKSAQTAVASALASAPAMATAQASPAANTPSPNSETPPPVSLENKSLAELYEIGVQTENKIAEAYKNVRAADVAALKQIPLAEAQKLVEVARPARPDLAASLSGEDVSSKDALDAKKESIEKALQEINSMVGQSRAMLSQARASEGGDGVTISTEAMRASVENANMLAAVATDRQDGTKTADLSEMMKQIEGGTTPPAGGEGAQTQKEGEKGAAGSSGPAGMAGTSGSGWTSNFRGDPAPPMGPVQDALPGRKVHAASTGTAGGKWMYLDTWYVIGPFPNADRKNIDTKFPPETVVNLDGVYAGVNDKPLRWQFVQTDQPRLRPPLERPYAIYYAYTTLWFDQPQDLWIGVGSDDFSKVWINDMLVWASGPQQKQWRPDEGFRKVHFKQGLNRVLYRIENGQSGCSWSLMLAANSDKAGPAAQ